MRKNKIVRKMEGQEREREGEKKKERREWREEDVGGREGAFETPLPFSPPLHRARASV